MHRRQLAILLIAITVSSALVIFTVAPNTTTTASADPAADIQGMDIAGDEATVNDSPETFTLDASGTVEWENIPGTLDGVEIYLEIEGPDGETTTVASQYTGGTAPDGSTEFSLSGDVFEQTGWEPSDFDPEDGETVSEELEVKITVFILSTANEGSNEEFAEFSDTITVTVHDATDDDGGNDDDSGSGSASIAITASGSADISE